MEANPLLFRDLTYIFVAALLGGLVAWRLRLPLILGFVLGVGQVAGRGKIAQLKADSSLRSE